MVHDTCSGTCYDTCSGTCYDTCSGTCYDTCSGTCYDTYSGTCYDTCSGTCYDTCNCSKIHEKIFLITNTQYQNKILHGFFILFNRVWNDCYIKNYLMKIINLPEMKVFP